MENLGTYLEILTDSLTKKSQILDFILVENQKQQMAVTGNQLDDSLFEDTVAKKEAYIQQLESLDSGFDSVYQRIKELLQTQKESYKAEIQKIQALISEVTQKSMEVQLSEKRNQQMIENCFSAMRQEVHQTKNVNQVANQYYKTMSKAGMVEPQYLDKKK